MALIDKLSAIGDAIREKTGTVEKLTLDEMPGMISQISGGGDSVEKFINFYDWDGTLLYQYTLPEFARMELRFSYNRFYEQSCKCVRNL